MKKHKKLREVHILKSLSTAGSAMSKSRGQKIKTPWQKDALSVCGSHLNLGKKRIYLLSDL
ncbi:hypothetical protein H6F70_05795 [Coleofasciculus sp. FACHB-T130]|uniref:hypothetical protein n=1 Tax=Trichocoleus sp. DQ-A2 TaxID=2933924 RepID=UPI0019CCB417|nr:hypothetical protein [Coleofasciculus sp. FACHB-T130]